MEKLFELFERCEDIRHARAIETNPEFFDPPRGENHYRLHHIRFLGKFKKHQFGGNTPTGENLDAIKKYGLSIDEASTVYMYTHHHIYRNVNYVLRNAKIIDEDVAEYERLLNKSLDKFPAYEKTIIYRDIRNPDDGVEKCLAYYQSKVNKEIIFNDFLSCHTDDVRISDKKTDFQFVIKTSASSNAKDISELTFLNLENEVLFKSGTKFLIEEIDMEDNKVYLREI